MSSANSFSSGWKPFQAEIRICVSEMNDKKGLGLVADIRSKGDYRPRGGSPYLGKIVHQPSGLPASSGKSAS